MAELDDKMWSMFLAQLTQKVGNVDPAEFMPTNGLALANWEVMDVTGLPPTGKEKPGDPLAAGVVQWADTMPSWSPTYVPGGSLYDNYVAFLGAIQLKGGDPAQQQIADGYAKKRAKARNKLRKDNAAVNQQWLEFNKAQASRPPENRETFTQWYNTNWASTISADIANVEAQDKNYRQALQAVGGPDYQTISSAQTKAELSAAAGNALLDAAGNPLPRYDITPALNKWYLSALQTASAGRGAQVDFTVDFSRMHEHEAVASSYIGGSISGSYSEFAWGGSASASYGQEERSSEFSRLLTNIRLRYTAQAVTVFHISDPQWFDGAFVRGFADQVSPNSAFADVPIFGPNGLLNLRARSLIVAYKPTIALEGSHEDLSAVANAFDQSSAASVSVGGFMWDVGASFEQGQSESSATVDVALDRGTVRIEDNSNNPKVIGVIPDRLD